MDNFKNYTRKGGSQLCPVTEEDMLEYTATGRIPVSGRPEFKVSISEADIEKGSPKIGDMISRNADNHDDQWLVEQAFFEKNFELEV